MESIDNSELERIAGILSNCKIGSHFLSTKIEAFHSTCVKITPVRKRRNSTNQKISGEISPYLAAGIILSEDINNNNSNNSNHNANSSNSSVNSITESQQNEESILRARPRSSSWGVLPIPKPQRRRTSSLGDLSEPSTRALFADFISTLNNAFPDYDYADTKIEQFKDDNIGPVLQVVNNYFAEVTIQYPNLLEQLWSAVDDIINLKACEVFRFTPDLNNDDALASIWQFHYFFFNKELKRLCYISCEAKSVFRRELEYGSDDDEEDEDARDYSPRDQSDSDMEYEDYASSQIRKDALEEDDDAPGDTPDWDGII